MKAKDTIIDSSERKEIAYSSEDEEDAILNACKAQAEITWDEAYKAGIREVVEWIQHNLPDYDFGDGWQAELREWGVGCCEEVKDGRE